MRKPGTLGSKKFGPGKLWVEKLGPKIFLAIFLLNSKKIGYIADHRGYMTDGGGSMHSLRI